MNQDYEQRFIRIYNASMPRRAFAIGLTAFLVSSVGCSSLSKDTSSKDSKWSLFRKKEYQKPKSLVAIWTEDKLIMPGKPVTRGFGGRIYFYNDRSQAIPVDGELIVYGFDDSARKNASLVSQEADRKYKFTPEQFTEHFSQGDLGASYSVWLPWDEDGSPQREITLFPTFITKSGQLIRGESAKVNLTGPKQDLPSMKQQQQLQVTAPQPNMVDPMLGMNQPLNQVQTASAVIPTNEAGMLPGLSDNSSSFGRSKSTTIAIPRQSAFRR